jgi:hypothetical protein
MRIVAVVLIVLGVVALAWGGISYTREKKIVDLGPIQATERTHEMIPVPPIVGGALLLSGIGLLIVEARGRR